jgi:hypothetical protein
MGTASASCALTAGKDEATRAKVVARDTKIVVFDFTSFLPFG